MIYIHTHTQALLDNSVENFSLMSCAEPCYLLQPVPTLMEGLVLSWLPAPAFQKP